MCSKFGRCTFVYGLIVFACLFVSGCEESKDVETDITPAKMRRISRQKKDIKRDLAKEAELQKKAEGGDLEAQLQLGSYYRDLRLYSDNDLSKQDEKFFQSESLKWVKIAAERGSAAAQVKLYEMYCMLWEPLYPNYVEAARWLDRAVKQDDLEAIYKLAFTYGCRGGNVYASWNTVIRYNSSKRADLYRKAAERGYVEAQYGLGEFYRNLGGYFYTRSGKYANLTWQERYSEAKKWYERAIDNGHELAKEKLEELQKLNELHSQLIKDKAFVEQLKYCCMADVECSDLPKGLQIEDFAPQFVAELNRQRSSICDFRDLTSEDYTEYIEHLKRSALPRSILHKRGNCKSQLLLGDIYSGLLPGDWEIEHTDWSERFAQAMKWYRLADKNGFCKCYSSKRISELDALMRLYRCVQNRKCSLEEAYCIGMGYLSCRNGFLEYDPKKAYEWLSVSGSTEALCLLADLLLSEKCSHLELEPRMKKAEEFYRKAVVREREDLNKRKFAEDRLEYLQKVKILLAQKKKGLLTSDEEYELSDVGQCFGGILSKEESIRLREEAAEHGSVKAVNELIQLGNMATRRYSLNAEYNDEDLIVAEKCYLKAISCGSEEAKVKLEESRKKRAEYPQKLHDEQDRLSLCKKAWQGDTEALSQLYYSYDYCRGRANRLKDKCEVLNLLNRMDGRAYSYLEASLYPLADREFGNVEAQYELGCLYYLWEGYLRDDPLSIYKFGNYGDNGKHEDIYFDKLSARAGEYSNRNDYYYAALRWWREAAQQGHADAQYCLGSLYDLGKGINERVDSHDRSLEAFRWWYKAASQGETYAQSAISRWCLCNYYPDKFKYVELKGLDMTKIFQFCQQAAEKGDADAQDQLSIMYLYGVGTEQNLEEAKKWSQKAAKHRGYYPYSAYLYGLHKLGLDKY